MIVFALGKEMTFMWAIEAIYRPRRGRNNCGMDNVRTTIFWHWGDMAKHELSPEVK